MTKTALSDSKGRIVCDIEVEGSDCDAFISSANYLTYTDETGSYKVPDDELDYLTEKYTDVVQEHVFENAVSAAEYTYEGDR